MFPNGRDLDDRDAVTFIAGQVRSNAPSVAAADFRFG